MRRNRIPWQWGRGLCVAAVLLGAGALPAFAEDAKPATTRAAVTPEARVLIGQVKSAYGKVQSLRLNGTMSADIDIAGKTQKRNTTLTGEYRAPGMYRHTLKDDVIAGSTGQRLYVLEVKRNVYATQAAPAKRVSYRQLPGTMGELLEVQDPGLLLAVSENSLADLLEGASDVHRDADTVLNGTRLPTLAFVASDGRAIALAFDPATLLLRQARYDISGLMRSRGAEQVNKALIVVAYDTVEPGAKLEPSAFAWTAPANAREVDSDVEEKSQAAALQGEAAPDFSLPSLEGKPVSLKGLKGHVVVLDFWATWCPPCVRSLPEIAEIHRTRKDTGVKVLAINVGEKADAVKTFLTQKKLDMPVLLDSGKDVSEKYAIRGIPTTVIIKPNGMVQKVFVGLAPGGRAEIEREIDAAGK